MLRDNEDLPTLSSALFSPSNTHISKSEGCRSPKANGLELT